MVGVDLLANGLLLLMRLLVFGMALGLTLISFQAYRENPTERLQFAFLGFAFISMGVAFSTIVGQLGSEADEFTLVLFRSVETVPFIVGFAMFYLSLYR
jgi:hypothetical protein